MRKNVLFVLIVVLLTSLLISLLPVWKKEGKAGIFRVNTWKKIQLMRGKIFMD